MPFEPVFINFEAQQESAGALLQENKEKNEGYKPGRSQNFRALPSRTFPLSDQEDGFQVGTWRRTRPVLIGGKRTVGKKKRLGPKQQQQQIVVP